MKSLTYMLACLIVISCATNEPNLHKTATAQEKVREKLKVMTTKTNGVETADTENQSVRLLIHSETSAPGVFSATLMIDPNRNESNYSIKDITALIIKIANSAGFSKTDCSLKQIACYLKEDIHLSLEFTETPEKIRLKIIKDKTALEKAADIAIQIFLEGLKLHLQQASQR